MPHTWSHLGDTVNDARYDMYYRGQKIREAYYRGKKIWGDEFLGILLVNLSEKLHYAPTERIDYTGAKILGAWAGGRLEDITADCEFFPEEGTLIDPSTVIVNIVVARLPNKVSYLRGEVLNYSGTTVLAVYADGHVMDISSECKFSPKPGTVIYPPSLIGIFVIKEPNKTTYVSGESFDFSGLAVVAVYTNGTTIDVTSECSITPE